MVRPMRVGHIRYLRVYNLRSDDLIAKYSRTTISEGFIVPQILAALAVLSLLATAGASAAQTQKLPATNGGCTFEKCLEDCSKHAGKYCNSWCNRRRSIGNGCARDPAVQPHKHTARLTSAAARQRSREI